MGKIHSVMEIQELVLSAPFAKFERYSVTKIKAKMTRFEQLNDSFGYQMSRMVFNDLFMQKTAQKSRLRGTLRYKISDKNNNNNGNGGRDDSSVLTTQQYPRLDAMWNVWTGQHNNLVSSTHYYPPANNSAVAVSNSTATVDVLLVCGGLLMVSKGTFSEKIDAIFDLFDTQDLGMLGFKQVLRMIRSLFTGWSKLCGFEEPAYDTCVSIATEAFKYSGVKVKNHKLSADEVYLWARSTELINRSLSRFGTTDSSEYHHKYLHSQKQGRTGRAMSTRKTQSSRGSESKIGRQFTKKGTIREVKNLKVLFESIDQDSTGVVAVDYLRKPKRQSANFQLRVVSCLFQEIPRELLPEHLSFSQLISYIYSSASEEEKTAMLSWVPEPLARSAIRQIMQVFNNLDRQFTGKVELGLCLETLASSAATASYVKYCEWNREYYASTQGQNKIRQNVYNMNKLKHKNKHKMKTSAAKVGNNMSNDDIIHTGSDNDAEQHVNINEENRLVASIDGQKNQKKRAHGRKNKAHPSIPLPPSQSLSSISLPSPSFSVPLSTPPRSTPAFSKKTTVSNNSQLVNKISNTKLRELVAGRELLHHLFGRSHQMEMKKIVGWCKPVRILTNAQLGELDSLFHSYEVNAGAGTASTDTDSTIALADFYEHLTEQGLSLKEIKRICKELDINIRDEGRSRVSQHQFMMFYRDIWDLRVNFRINDLRSTRQGAHLETHLNSPKYTQHHGQPYANISMHKSTYRG